MLMFSVFDEKVGAFLPPMFMRSRGEAIRSFSAAVGSKDHQFSMFPSDFVLYFLGEFNDQNGSFITVPTPERLLKASDVVNPDNPVLAA